LGRAQNKKMGQHFCQPIVLGKGYII